jgi:uncharacterized protein (TIGR03435 family)
LERIVKHSDRSARCSGRKHSVALAPAALLLAALLVCGGVAPLRAQSQAAQTSTPQAAATPVTSSAAQPQSAQSAPATAPADDWMKTAGGPQAFDVASVKQNKSGFPPAGDRPYSNFPLGPGDVYSPNGGLFTTTNMPLLLYISFAYKLSSSQTSALQAQLPKWVMSSSYDIQARADGNPTKDQMRMMMQSLLADRFKLTVHNETRQLPVFGLALVKTGKLGPQLQPHPADASCSTAPPAPQSPGSGPSPPATVPGGYPTVCGGVVGSPSSTPGRFRFGARNVTIALVTSAMSNPLTGIDRPVVDETGLTGTFDFTVEFTPELGPLPPGVSFTPDPTGPTFQQALKEQLGLKLDSQSGSVNVFIVDHIEQPTEN